MDDDVQAYAPGDLSTEETEACISVIEEGCAADPESAAKELPQAMVVVLKRHGVDVVGVGAIKRKRPNYAADIARKSGFQFDQNSHELGYVAVRKSHQRRGLSKEITSALLAAFSSRPLFATTSHEAMKRTLEQAGFVRQGHDWPGKDAALSLWIKTTNPPV